MLRQRTTLLVAPAVAALLGAGAMSHAMAQTVITAPLQMQTTVVPAQTTTTTVVPVQTTPATTVVVAPMAPPAPLTETVPAAPATATVTTYWQPGHWYWDGTNSNWVWIDGAYMQRVQQPAVTAVWVQGQWVMQADGTYAWVAGHWQG